MNDAHIQERFIVSGLLRHLSENNLDIDYSKIVKVEEGDWAEEKDLWIIYVNAKKTINGNLILTVDKTTGEIKNRGRTKW